MERFSLVTSAKQKVFGYQNAKTIKGEKLGWTTAIRYLAPADESGQWNVCANAGACKAVCLYTAGRGRFAAVKAARIAKTRWRMTDRAGHMLAAASELGKAYAKADREGQLLCVRLNGTSDLPGDALELARALPEIQFYDYTKLVGSVRRYARGEYPKNYHLTLSYDPQTVPWLECRTALDAGVNVAVCFAVKRGQPLPTFWGDFRVIDGDEHDLRFLDPRGVIVGLRAKGAAKRLPYSHFTVEVNT